MAIHDVFSPAEIEALRDHFMQMQQDALEPSASLRQHYKPLSLDAASGDILKHFPRIMHPARFDAVSFDFMLDECQLLPVVAL